MKPNLFYENKVRTRTSGILIKNNKILLVEHSLNGKVFFAPPGGGVEFGETLNESLMREFKEETDLRITNTKFLFITEYISSPLHAIEVFYHVKSWDGEVTKGLDPENYNLIKDVKWFSIEDIKSLKTREIHHIFQYCNNLRDIFTLSGYITYPTV